ncbi:MAG TPA: PEP-CTERM sorting domain-containing protein [Phycisphaerae bacterium]|nr:PEP-CTERM sorting domain-containing protein [Phycisphaerae bacterium]
MRILLITSAAAVLALTTAAKADLAFWDVSPNTNVSPSSATPYNWAPGSTSYVTANGLTTGSYSGIDYSIWDEGGPYSSNVNNFGGEQFDVKAMYTKTVGGIFYVGIVTGFNPAGVGDPYSGGNPVAEVGDLAINPNWADDTAQNGVILPIASAPSSGNTSVVAGGTWDIPLLSVGVPKPPDTVYEDGTGTVVSATDATYSYTDLGDQYYDSVINTNVDVYLYQISVPLSDLSDSPSQVSWGMDCNNDSLQVDVPLSDVPEPTSMTLFAAGAVGLLAKRRKRA